jgi:transcriptional regulator with XRE-family HTH domain
MLLPNGGGDCVSTIEARFKETRKKMGVSQRTLAEQTGVSLGSIRRFEQSGEISLSSLKKLLEYLHRDTDLSAICADTESIPEQFKVLFWDVDIKKLHIHKDADYIISRMLSYGDIKAMVWALNEYSPKEMIHCATHSRALNKLSANYLRTKFRIDKSKMPYYCVSDEVWPY